MNQKGFANILSVVVIVVFLIGAVGYFALMKKSEPTAQQPTPTPTQTQKLVSPTPTPTANWKTYTNEKYGFEFKYPNNFQYLYTKESNEAPIVVKVDEMANAPYYKNFFRIIVSPITQYPSGISSTCLGAKSSGIIKIGNGAHEKYLLSSERTNEFTTLCVNVVRDKYLFEFYADSYSKDGLVIDKILSTFKFTNAKPAADASDWKTYRDNQYGFEVKFPSQWNEYKKLNGVGFGQGDGYGFDITIISTTKTLEQYLREKDQEMGNLGPVISVEWAKNITISGLPAVQRGEFANSPGWENVVTYVPRSRIIYELTKVGRYSGSLADRSMYDKILSTFKFLP